MKENSVLAQELNGHRIIKVTGNKIYLDNGLEIRISVIEIKVLEFMIKNQVKV